MTTAVPKARKRSWRKVLTACTVMLLLTAIVLHQIIAAILIAAVVLAALVLVLRARWTRYAVGGWIAARKRRRYQGWAGFGDVRRVTRAARTLTRRLSPEAPGAEDQQGGLRGTPPSTRARPATGKPRRWPATPLTPPA